MQAMIPAVRNFCEWAALRGGETRPEFERALSVVEWDGDITLPEPTNPPVAAWHLETACGFSGETGSPARAVADVDAVRELTRLPDTADELKALAAAQGVGEETIYLQARATETRVRSMDLSDYRILAFATHGLVSGELSGLAEPALVFTPPETGTEADDGLLTASEIATLKLDADWVILSACNTAAADGTPGAEGLSGMAKAFFYAGARALLVSHWAVNSEAAVFSDSGSSLKRQSEWDVIIQ